MPTYASKSGSRSSVPISQHISQACEVKPVLASLSLTTSPFLAPSLSLSLSPCLNFFKCYSSPSLPDSINKQSWRLLSLSLSLFIFKPHHSLLILNDNHTHTHTRLVTVMWKELCVHLAITACISNPVNTHSFILSYNSLDFSNRSTDTSTHIEEGPTEHPL